MTELHSAVESGNFTQVLDILRRDPSRVNDRDKSYSTPLHFVYYGVSDTKQANDRLPKLQLLLDYGADVNARDAFNNTPLHTACADYWNQTESVKLLLERGADPNLRNSRNYTVLLYAVKIRNDKNVELLLKYGADINAVDWNDCTSLDSAILFQNFVAARILMKAGAKARNIFESISSINYNYFQQGENLIKFLIEYGAEIDFYGNFSPRALYFAWIKGNDAKFIEKIMLERGIDVEELKRQGEGLTELHVAVQKNNEAQVRALLQAGADVNAKTVLGETPLHLLLDGRLDYDQLYKVAKLFIEAGADCHVRDSYGFTAFQKAVFRGCHKILNLMLARISGIEESTLKSFNNWPTGSDEYRNSYPLAVATVYGYEEVVDRLIEMGHHTEVMSHANYKPPLYYAVEESHYRITKMLLEVGCGIDERIKLERCTRNLEIICLLWEYDCIVILQKLLIYAFTYIMQSRIQDDLVVDLILFYYKISSSSNKWKKDFFSMTGSFYLDENLSSILSSYDDRIEELKKDMVCDSLSKYDLLTRKMNSFVTFLNDENNLKACQKLRSSLDRKEDMENYDYAIKVRLDLATEKRKILDCAKDCLNQILQDGEVFLTYEIISNILSYLNMRELKKMSIKY